MRCFVLGIVMLSSLVLQGCAPLIVGGVVGAALIVGDRRTSGTYVDDQGLELKASEAITPKWGERSHINITSYNRQVLLSGEAPSEEARLDIENTVRALPNVKSIYNEITVGENVGLKSRSQDTYITSKVKARMIEAGKVEPHLVKVVTENGVVYLMGIVTHQEARDATETARTTSDVKKVVKLFEYTD